MGINEIKSPLFFIKCGARYFFSFFFLPMKSYKSYLLYFLWYTEFRDAGTHHTDFQIHKLVISFKVLLYFWHSWPGSYLEFIEIKYYKKNLKVFSCNCFKPHLEVIWKSSKSHSFECFCILSICLFQSTVLCQNGLVAARIADQEPNKDRYKPQQAMEAWNALAN